MAVDTDVLAVVVRPPMVRQSHLRQTVWTRRLPPSALETKPVPAQTASSTMHAGAHSARARSVEDLAALSRVAKTYYAFRYVRWEVGNGGSAQAMLNIPHKWSQVLLL